MFVRGRGVGDTLFLPSRQLVVPTLVSQFIYFGMALKICRSNKDFALSQCSYLLTPPQQHDTPPHQHSVRTHTHTTYTHNAHVCCTHTHTMHTYVTHTMHTYAIHTRARAHTPHTHTKQKQSLQLPSGQHWGTCVLLRCYESAQAFPPGARLVTCRRLYHVSQLKVWVPKVPPGPSTAI